MFKTICTMGHMQLIFARLSCHWEIIKIKNIFIFISFTLGLFWHIFKGIFYHYEIRFVGTLIFTIENQWMFFFF